MRSKVKFSVVVLALASAIVAYFGASFLVADYVDVGDSCPSYLLRYRIGSRSLHGLATIFEPARRIDESVLLSPVGSKGTTPGRNWSLLVIQNPPPGVLV